MLSYIRNLHPALQLIVLITLSLTCSLIASVVAFAIAIPVWGNIAMSYSVENPEIPVSLHQFMQAMSQIGAFLVPAILFAKLYYEHIIKFFKLTFSSKVILPTLLGILLIVTLIPFLDRLSEWNQGWHFPESMQNTEIYWRDKELVAVNFFKTLTNGSSHSVLGINLFVIALLPAICEEFVFRGVLQQFFKKLFNNNNAHVAIWLTAIIFTLFHAQMFSFVPRLILGLLLGYSFQYGKTLFIPIAIHFVNNAIAVVFSFLYQQGDTVFNPEKLELPGNSYLWIITSVLLSVVLFFAFLKSCSNSSKISQNSQNTQTL